MWLMATFVNVYILQKITQTFTQSDIPFIVTFPHMDMNQPTITGVALFHKKVGDPILHLFFFHFMPWILRHKIVPWKAAQQNSINLVHTRLDMCPIIEYSILSDGTYTDLRCYRQIFFADPTLPLHN
jgi:hypothetical protein